MDQRPSPSDARRVNGLIMRGQQISASDQAVAGAILARYDGLRGKYWIGFLYIGLGVGNAVVHSLTHSTVWLHAVVGALLVLAGARWIYTIHRVRGFQRAGH